MSAIIIFVLTLRSKIRLFRVIFLLSVNTFKSNVTADMGYNSMTAYKELT